MTTALRKTVDCLMAYCVMNFLYYIHMEGEHMVYRVRSRDGRPWWADHGAPPTGRRVLARSSASGARLPAEPLARISPGAPCSAHRVILRDLALFSTLLPLPAASSARVARLRWPPVPPLLPSSILMRSTTCCPLSLSATIDYPDQKCAYITDSLKRYIRA